MGFINVTRSTSKQSNHQPPYHLLNKANSISRFLGPIWRHPHPTLPPLPSLSDLLSFLFPRFLSPPFPPLQPPNPLTHLKFQIIQRTPHPPQLLLHLPPQIKTLSQLHPNRPRQRLLYPLHLTPHPQHLAIQRIEMTRLERKVLKRVFPPLRRDNRRRKWKVDAAATGALEGGLGGVVKGGFAFEDAAGR
ncbi:uncharacterized protein BDZ99DRAFT_62836 [Mytilinidion resinicola]|uniref:Uncharacterized protein n=1 Tax=Mytilinidion resinicola TaxID=574789 RepID=A0A6A6YI93_9PEZI|nr:uncharacterized protein BDZ99DRAFT_62836 [Mytilinidion resinicola]KAF2807695.1 hypothetical protein BDZ99DRAFT_62836 [Mytilinidion resinicola]